MVVGWSIPVMLEFIGYGSAILINIYKKWDREDKKEHRYNEVFYGILYIFFGILSPFLFRNDGLPPNIENRLYMIMFLGFISLDLFWWLFNLLPNIIACKKHPELKEERSYQKFIQFITENNVETIKRDATRKFLHVFMFSIVVGLYVFATMNKSLVQDQWGFINYWAFCKFFYTFIAYAFNNMFTLADLVRNNKFYWLPNWARKWFSTSIDPREGNTFISSIPYVLTLSLFQFAPPQILFIATSMSTFADASASLFGRAFGKHHFPEKLDSKKTYEGLIAGALAAFLSTALILVAFPLQNQNYGIIVMVGTVSTMVFIIIDMFIQKIADNITNVLFAGLASWLVIIMMGGLF